MQVQVNTGNGLGNGEALERWADGFLQQALQRFAQDLSRIEVQLSDENGDAKGGTADIRCTLEARLNGREPVAVHNHAGNQDLAIRGAAEKLAHALDHIFGKLDRHEHRGRTTIRRDPSVIS